MSSRRPPPHRIYEPNIIHNPLHWMGIWTPDGWRIHSKRWGGAERLTISLSGDSRTTFFPEVLRDPRSGQVEWGDDLHVTDDPLTDGGIYPCDPRVEYPVGRPRWAISHTLLCYPVADHTLYTHEYVWDLEHGHLQTHFRRHVVLEPARTDATSGCTVTVANTPLSTCIEGNVCYPLANSAVRGIWDNPEKRGRNYYTQRVCCLLPMANGVYVRAPQHPVVQCHGLYQVSDNDSLERAFDTETGICVDSEYLIEQMKIPLDAPRLGMLRAPLNEVPSALYEGKICMPGALEGIVDEQQLEQLKARMGARFAAGQVGFAIDNSFDGRRGAAGYVPAFDFNENGQIDAEDADFLRRHLGREVRFNLYLDGYFGGDWLSTSCCLEPEHRPGVPLIADYEFGGGYDAEAGTIRLLDTPGPDRPVWVEYYHDAPADAGENNIRVHIYRERT